MAATAHAFGAATASANNASTTAPKPIEEATPATGSPRVTRRLSSPTPTRAQRKETHHNSATITISSLIRSPMALHRAPAAPPDAQPLASLESQPALPDTHLQSAPEAPTPPPPIPAPAAQTTAHSPTIPFSVVPEADTREAMPTAEPTEAASENVTPHDVPMDETTGTNASNKRQMPPCLNSLRRWNPPTSQPYTPLRSTQQTALAWCERAWRVAPPVRLAGAACCEGLRRGVYG
ncbi:hypothetical protein GQ54DRAFT_315133 [Martensiomyces pterosporus]|nr:hypothetical protein GQ54DRAFT_315133 [Martensiomyces pterosporus]